MKNKYVALYQKNADFLNKRPRLKKAVILYNGYVSLLFVLAFAGLWIYGICSPDFIYRDFVKLFCVPALAFFISSVLRSMIDRPRPYDERGAGITPLKKKESSNSFPSRHLASASVIAMAFLPYAPVISGILFALSLGLGYSRFALGWHYPSDLIAGFLLGAIIGLGMFL